MGAPFPKIGERLRLFALFYENCRQSQAVCIFGGALAPKIGERLRLFALFYEIGRQSQAVCAFWALRLFAFFETTMMKLAESLRLCALHSRKVRSVSGSLHAFDGIADSLRLFALFGHSTHENGGTSQAICIC